MALRSVDGEARRHPIPQTAIDRDVPNSVPTGVAIFPKDFRSIRRFAERANNIVHWSQFDRGGHFAAMDAPDLLVEDIRKFFRRFR